IAAEISTCRGVVMPSRYPEPFGLVATEASLSGMPVVAADTALLGAEIAAAGLGYMCNTRDIDVFADALRRLAHMDRVALRAMSLKAASGVAGLCLSQDQWINAQVTLYDQALSEPARHSA
ncbi:MAG: glycosyltransferase, partial [Paracoccaceae bacterium]